MIMNQTEKKGSNNIMNTKPKTLGELKSSGYKYKSIKDELRDNLVHFLEFTDMSQLSFRSSSAPFFPSIISIYWDCGVRVKPELPV
jgi:hypothetical protein